VNPKLTLRDNVETDVLNATALASEVSKSGDLSDAALITHRKLGHPGEAVGKMLNKRGLLSVQNVKLCDSCVRAKAVRTPFVSTPAESKDVTQPLDRVHIDLVCLPNIPSFGNRYALIAIDEFSRYAHTRFLKTRERLFSYVREYCLMQSKKFKFGVRRIRADLEFRTNEIEEFAKQEGIILEFSAARSSGANGLIERFLRTIFDHERALRFDAKLADSYWRFSVATAVYLLNLTPRAGLNGFTPHELWHGSVPSFKHLHVFGCLCYAVDTDTRKKTDPKALRGRFLGYDTYAGSKSKYFVQLLEGDRANSIIVTRDVRFVDNVMADSVHRIGGSVTGTSTGVGTGGSHISDLLLQSLSDADTDDADNVIQHVQPVQPAAAQPVQIPAQAVQQPAQAPAQGVHGGDNDNDNDSAEDTGDSAEDTADEDVKIDDIEFGDHDADGDVKDVAPNDAQHLFQRRVSTRNAGPPVRFGEFFTYVSLPVDIEEPKSDDEALSHPAWRQAMREELEALKELGTFSLVKQTSDIKPISCKWVHKVKRRADGTIERLKSRLVARGFQQRNDSYTETYAPVARSHSFRVLVAIAASCDMYIDTYDIRNAYLQADLEDDIYMTLPAGVVDDDGNIIKLCRPLYGTKQGAHRWYIKLRDALISEGFEVADNDPCVFVARRKDGLAALSTHVDDVFSIASSAKIRSWIALLLQKHFKLRRSEHPDTYLGVCLIETDSEIFLHQSGYVKKLLKDYDMQNCKPASVPMSARLNAFDETCDTAVDQTDYRTLLGKLQYLGTTTRPDISLAVNSLARFSNKPAKRHMDALYFVLRYLRANPSLGLTFKKRTPLNMNVFSDSDFAGSMDCRRSTTGFVILVADTPVIWKAGLQTSIATSTCHAETTAAFDAVRKLSVLSGLISEIGFSIDTPTVAVDNSALYNNISNISSVSMLVKQLGISIGYLREQFANNLFRPVLVRTTENVADVLTKPLARQLFVKFRDQLKLTIGGSVVNNARELW